MKSSFRHVADTRECSYLPDELARLEFDYVAELTADEYADRMLAGWRRFGHTLMRPMCPHCRACRSLRVDVAQFRPDRSQQRNRRANEGQVCLEISSPWISASRLRLSRRFHESRSEKRGWPDRDYGPTEFYESFVSNPFETEEWHYTLDGELVGLGHVDALRVGLSAIYFIHAPELSRRGLGTWNVLCLIEEARRRGLPHVYLGYHVANCQSLAYKARFRPFEQLGEDGLWHAENEPESGSDAESRES